MADTYNFQAPKPQFDIGRVINRTFGAIKNNFISFFMASFVIMGIPVFLVSVFPLMSGFSNTVGIGLDSAGFITMAIVSSIVILVGSVILQGALIFGAIADFNGRRARFGECMSVALRYFLPLLGLGILVGFGTMLGFLLLVIPGIIVALGWICSAPVLIVEDQGVTDSMSRSWELTGGYKWWILLLAIIYLVISALIGGVQGAFTEITGGADYSGPSGFLIINAFLAAVIQAVTTMISATGAAAIYFELRQIKEGVGAENLAAVFD